MQFYNKPWPRKWTNARSHKSGKSEINYYEDELSDKLWIFNIEIWAFYGDFYNELTVSIIFSRIIIAVQRRVSKKRIWILILQVQLLIVHVSWNIELQKSFQT